MRAEIKISQQWNGTHLPGDEVVAIIIEEAPSDVRVHFTARLTETWRVPKTPAGFTPGLWDFDVLEIFFARPDGTYLEIEAGPAGHFLVYEFASYRKASDKSARPLAYTYKVEDGLWQGAFDVPLLWLRVPLEKCRVNAYQIRTSIGGVRQYLAWRSLPEIAPDFHRIECFELLHF